MNAASHIYENNVKLCKKFRDPAALFAIHYTTPAQTIQGGAAKLRKKRAADAGAPTTAGANINPDFLPRRKRRARRKRGAPAKIGTYRI